MTRGEVCSIIDWEKGEGGEGSVDCGSGGPLTRPPASFGSGLKRGETCTFILEFEGDAIGTACPCELV